MKSGCFSKCSAEQSWLSTVCLCVKRTQGFFTAIMVEQSAFRHNLDCGIEFKFECGHSQIGRIHAAAFSDAVLYAEIYNKASFWQQSNFYGIDVNALHGPATEGFFSQVGSAAR